MGCGASSRASVSPSFSGDAAATNSSAEASPVAPASRPRSFSLAKKWDSSRSTFSPRVIELTKSSWKLVVRGDMEDVAGGSIGGGSGSLHAHYGRGSQSFRMVKKLSAGSQTGTVVASSSSASGIGATSVHATLTQRDSPPPARQPPTTTGSSSKDSGGGSLESYSVVMAGGSEADMSVDGGSGVYAPGRLGARPRVPAYNKPLTVSPADSSDRPERPSSGSGVALVVGGVATSAVGARARIAALANEMMMSQQQQPQHSLPQQPSPAGTIASLSTPASPASTMDGIAHSPPPMLLSSLRRNSVGQSEAGNASAVTSASASQLASPGARAGSVVFSSPIVAFFDAFYGKMFQLDPGLLVLFKHHSLKVQGKMLVKMLDTFVGGLQDTASLREPLEELARRHALYGVKSSMYGYLSESLAAGFQAALGEGYTPEVHEAWQTVFQYMTRVMMPIARRAERALRWKKQLSLLGFRKALDNAS